MIYRDADSLLWETHFDDIVVQGFRVGQYERIYDGLTSLTDAIQDIFCTYRIPMKYDDGKEGGDLTGAKLPEDAEDFNLCGLNVLAHVMGKLEFMMDDNIVHGGGR